MNRRVWLIALAVLVLLHCIRAYLATPLNIDVLVNLGASRQAELNGGGLHGVLLSWDLRGIGHKLMLFGLHSIASTTVGYGNKFAYEAAIKAPYAVFLLIAALVSAICVSQSIVSTTLHRCYAFLFVSLSLFTVSNSWVALQADMTAAVVALIAMCALTNRRPTVQYLGGVLVGLTVLFKGITLLTGLSAACAAFALIPEKSVARFRRFSVAVVATGSLIVVFLLTVARAEIVDLREATMFQSSFELSLVGRARLVAHTLVSEAVHVPLIYLGVVAFSMGLWVVCRSMRSDGAAGRSARVSLREVALLLVAVSLALAGVGIQARGYGYHLASLIPACVAICAWSLRVVCERRAALAYRLVPAGVACSIFLVVSPGIGPIGSVMAKGSEVASDNDSWTAYRRSEIAGFQKLSDVAQMKCAGPMLYLDDGRAAYYFGERSWLRHTYPLPLQRNNPRLATSDVRTNSLRRAEEFSGRCVVLYREWINPEGRPWLNDLFVVLDRDYKRIGSTSGFDLLAK